MPDFKQIAAGLLIIPLLLFVSFKFAQAFCAADPSYCKYSWTAFGAIFTAVIGAIGFYIKSELSH